MSALAEQPNSSGPTALRDVPPFPAVAAQLMRVVSEEDDAFSYKAVADLIRADAAFSVEVLRLANSPVFGFRHEIRDIPHALAILGIDRLRAIVTTLAMKDILTGEQQHEAVQRSWRHNLATAIACELIAPAFWVDSGFAYTAGLLHDIGLLALVVTHPNSYAELMNSTIADTSEFLNRETELVGLNHCEAGEWLLTEWDLPEPFRLVAEQHHGPENKQTAEVVRLVSLGCETAEMAGFGVTAVEPVWQPDLVLEQLPEGLHSRYRGRLEAFPLDVATRINSFDCDFLG